MSAENNDLISCSCCGVSSPGSMSPRSSTPSDWQLAYTGIRERTAHLLQAALWTDCTFIVGAEAEVNFTGHKVIMAIASPVFEAMFFGPMAGGNEPIVIPDIQPEAFKILMQYVYTDSIQIFTHEQAFDVFYAAKKYMLPRLVRHCSTFLQTTITTQTVFQTYEMAALFEEYELMDACMKEICSHASKIITEPSFLDINLETMMKMFSQSSMNISSEMELFHAAERYVTAKGVQLNVCPDCAKKVDPVKDTTVTPSSSEGTEERKQSTEVLEELLLHDYEECDKEIDAKVPAIRRAVHQIRFLSLSVEQLASALVSGLVSRPDALALLLAVAAGTPPPPHYASTARPRNYLYRSKLPKPSPKPNEAEKAEGIIHFTVQNFKPRKRRIDSEAICINGISWKVQVSPTGEQPSKALGVSVVPLDWPLQGRPWLCRAHVVARLLNQRDPAKHRHSSFTHDFKSNDRGQSDQGGHGWPKFLSWDTACDPAYGFLKNNAIIFEVHIVAYAPKAQESHPIAHSSITTYESDTDSDVSDY